MVFGEKVERAECRLVFAVFQQRREKHGIQSMTAIFTVRVVASNPLFFCLQAYGSRCEQKAQGIWVLRSSIRGG